MSMTEANLKLKMLRQELLEGLSEHDVEDEAGLLKKMQAHEKKIHQLEGQEEGEGETAKARRASLERLGGLQQPADRLHALEPAFRGVVSKEGSEETLSATHHPLKTVQAVRQALAAELAQIPNLAVLSDRTDKSALMSAESRPEFKSDLIQVSKVTVLSDRNASIPLEDTARAREEAEKVRLPLLVSATGSEGEGIDFSVLHSELSVGKELGRGGYGVVYHGRYAYAEVAIKCLYLTHPTGETLNEFAKESDIMVRLRHPHVIQPYAICYEPGHYSLVMELMPKGSLYDVISSSQALSWEQRWVIANDVASGLAYLHQKKVIHGDLSSKNVLLSDTLRAKVSDFGLSKVKLDSKVLTEEGKKRSTGTLRWKAPELFIRGNSNNKASDVYSVGVVLWEVSALRHPFEGESEEAIIKRIKEGRTETLPSDCPQEMGQVIEGCWSKTPDKRPSSNEIAQRLSSWKASFFEKSAQGGEIVPAAQDLLKVGTYLSKL